MLHSRKNCGGPHFEAFGGDGDVCSLCTIFGSTLVPQGFSKSRLMFRGLILELIVPMEAWRGLFGFPIHE